MTEELPFRVRSWYGLPAEIAVGRVWHWVKAGPVPLPHPGLVDLHLRQGLPRRERERLTYLHEQGHLETLPLAALHGVALGMVGRRRKGAPWWARVLVGLLAWLAGWELFAEFYTVARTGSRYTRLYRKARTPMPTALFFWVGMWLLAVGGSMWMWKGSEFRVQSSGFRVRDSGFGVRSKEES